MSTTQVKEHPIIFSAPMVRAILDGSKTQTRRVVKPQPKGFWSEPNQCIAGGVLQAICHDPNAGNVGKVSDKYIGCPYGKPGDRLWVRETWGVDCCCGLKDAECIASDHAACVFWRATDETPLNAQSWERHWRPSIHMPRWASRITLEVVRVRVERVQEITYEDCLAEGIERADSVPYGCYQRDTIERFRDLWDSINAKRGHPWAGNQWVWVVEFRRILEGGGA